MTTPVQPVHEVPPPIEDDQLATAIAAILMSGATAAVMLGAIQALLAPLGISKQAVLLAYSVTAGRQSPVPGVGPRGGVAGVETRIDVLPNNKPSAQGLSASTDVMRAARAREAHYRAAYMAKAAGRIHHELVSGTPVRTALADESLHYRSHAKARRNRLDTAGGVAKNALIFGDLLGWYRDPFSNSEAECIAASGNNFSATKGTLIGFPGAVHPHCRCHSGPPHEGGRMVNDVLQGRISIAAPRLYSVKSA